MAAAVARIEAIVAEAASKQAEREAKDVAKAAAKPAEDKQLRMAGMCRARVVLTMPDKTTKPQWCWVSECVTCTLVTKTKDYKG